MRLSTNVINHATRPVDGRESISVFCINKKRKMAAIKESAVPNGPKEMRKPFQYPGDMPPELYDWVPAQQEGFKEKLTKKLKQNPFVPIGCLATAGALTYGLVMFKRGNTARSQTMMRARVAAQGLTIAAVLVGVAMGAGKTTPAHGPK